MMRWLESLLLTALAYFGGTAFREFRHECRMKWAGRILVAISVFVQTTFGAYAVHSYYSMNRDHRMQLQVMEQVRAKEMMVGQLPPDMLIQRNGTTVSWNRFKDPITYTNKREF